MPRLFFSAARRFGLLAGAFGLSRRCGAAGGAFFVETALFGFAGVGVTNVLRLSTQLLGFAICCFGLLTGSGKFGGVTGSALFVFDAFLFGDAAFFFSSFSGGSFGAGAGFGGLTLVFRAALRFFLLLRCILRGKTRTAIGTFAFVGFFTRFVFGQHELVDELIVEIAAAFGHFAFLAEGLDGGADTGIFAGFVAEVFQGVLRLFAEFFVEGG